MAKKKLNNLDQTHGKSEESETKPSTLDQIWGDTGMWRYKTTDANEYKSYLDSLNKSDLQSHASRIGVIPSDSRDLLSQKLIKEFKRFVAGYRHPKSKNQNPPKISAAAQKILNEGK